MTDKTSYATRMPLSPSEPVLHPEELQSPLKGIPSPSTRQSEGNEAGLRT